MKRKPVSISDQVRAAFAAGRTVSEVHAMFSAGDKTAVHCAIYRLRQTGEIPAKKKANPRLFALRFSPVTASRLKDVAELKGLSEAQAAKLAVAYGLAVMEGRQ